MIFCGYSWAPCLWKSSFLSSRTSRLCSGPIWRNTCGGRSMCLWEGTRSGPAVVRAWLSSLPRAWQNRMPYPVVRGCARVESVMLSSVEVVSQENVVLPPAPRTCQPVLHAYRMQTLWVCSSSSSFGSKCRSARFSFVGRLPHPNS